MNFVKLSSVCVLQSHLTKSVTRFCMPIPVNQQIGIIAVTIWKLATNVDYQTISALFEIGFSTICEIVHCICHAMAEHVLPKYVKRQYEKINSGL